VDILAGPFFVALYNAAEEFWKKGFDAAWTPVGKALKEHFARWAGTDQESQRRAAFARSAGHSRELTTCQAAAPSSAERVLAALNSEHDPKGAGALAEEAAKLMLFSATLDVPRLTRLCQAHLNWDALWAGEADQAPPTGEEVVAVLSDLREALLDQEPYHDLVQRKMLRHATGGGRVAPRGL
jgi:hypothetical protein